MSLNSGVRNKWEDVESKNFLDVRLAINWFVQHVVDLLNLKPEQVVQQHIPLHVVESHVILNNFRVCDFNFFGLSLHNKVLGSHIKLSIHKGLEGKGRGLSAVWQSSDELNGELKVVAFSNYKAFVLVEVHNISVRLVNRDIEMDLTILSINLVNLEN